MTSRSRRFDEGGAVALLVAMLAVVLMGLGAIAVDIGHAYAKRSLLQTDVDLAVMAAAAELDNAGGCNPEVVSKAVEFLTKSENAVPGQYELNLGGSAGDDDGFIRCQSWRVELWAPRSHVEFGLGQVISDEDGVDVAAHAVAEIRSPAATATLPFFSVEGCDEGAQSLRNDSGTSTPPPLPPLTPTSATSNPATFELDKSEAPAGTTSMPMTLTGEGFTGATAVGFTGAAGPPYHHEVPISPTPTGATGSITVDVPSDVLAVEDVWYVRVLIDGEWSAQQEARRFTVGEPRLYCDASLQGNFGTLDLPRDDTNSSPLEWNMILGIQPTLAVHPSPNGQCDGQPGSIQSVRGPVDGSNCVLTETGLKMAATNDGFIQGKGGLDGRLDADSTSNCSRSDDNSRTPTEITGKRVNDDRLSCFIVNEARIGDLVAGNAVGTRALSADLFLSPRFFWIPVLETEPTTGAKWWPIVDFRAGFVTDQSLSASHDAPGQVGEFNGLVEDSSGIRELRVILLDELALPVFAPARGGETTYTGTGTKVVVLVE
jgi:hypothetical protein